MSEAPEITVELICTDYYEAIPIPPLRFLGTFPVTESGEIDWEHPVQTPAETV